jgi:GntR family transcriptional regulator
MGTVSIPFDPDIDGPNYVYVKLANYLAARIDDGTIPSGAMLPNERSLATECGVAVGTARRATRLLRERGLVITLPRKGTFVARTDTQHEGIGQIDPTYRKAADLQPDAGNTRR